jgi:hypothetical protein
METTMASEEEPALCHVKGCLEPATATCDRCGQPCCAEHIKHLTIQRRALRTHQPNSTDVLARLPTYTETYTLCPRCSTKPVLRG